jgi:hypothetical protein
MWLQATLEQGITVIEQVMRRDRRAGSLTTSIQ